MPETETTTSPRRPVIDGWPAFVQTCLGLLKSTGYQASICFAFAGSVTLAAIAADVGITRLPPVFLLSTFVALPFVKAFNTPIRVARRELNRLKAMKEVEAITENEYEKCRANIAAWLESSIVPSLADRSGRSPELEAPRKTARKRGR
jgi:hypothetical protein